MKFEYKCSTCQWVIRSDYRADWMWCANPHCDEKARRIWSVNLASVFQSHFNPSTGTVLSSPAEHRSSLSRATDEMNERGIPANFQPVDLRDKAALGVTNDGLDATYDQMKRDGRDDDARKLKQLMDE